MARTVRILPLSPEGRLRVRHAAAWLREQAPAYAALVAEGFLPGYDGARADFYFLARDFGTMVETASDALANDCDVLMEREPTGDSEAIGALARIVAIPSVRWEDMSGDVLGVAYEELREELLRRYEPALVQPFEDIAAEDRAE